MTATGPDLPGMRCLQDLGSGGFADVHLYERDQPRIKVAVKLLRIDKVTDSQRRQFTAEADAMAELAEHPYIVSVHGAGTAPDGRPYLVMNYYPGPDLLEQVGRKPLGPAEALRTGIKLAGALETAHRAGIVHRDIKPANVLMSSYGEPGLTDFGIAGRNGQAEDDGQVGVSIPWAAPEVIAGQSNGTVGSDVYSLAATVWHLLAGRSPFSVPGDNSIRAITARILHSPASATGRADVPSSLDRVLQQALAKRPELRPQSVMEFGRLLQGVEQELRLARTPIVVPDTSQVARSSLAEAGEEVEEATMLKRPLTVRPSAPSAPSPPRPVRPSFDPAPTDRRPSVVPTSAELTDRRPARPSRVATPASEELTERRPQRIEPAAALLEDDPNTGRRWVAAAVVVGLLLVTAIVAVVLANSGGGKPQTSDPPNEPGPSSASDIIPDGGGPVAPTISARVSGAKVVFSAPAPELGATYQWFLAPTGGTIAPIAGADDKTRVVVPADASGSTCVKLRVTLDGASTLGGRCAP